jgi:Flp pilus assembly protein TadD
VVAPGPPAEAAGAAEALAGAAEATAAGAPAGAAGARVLRESARRALEGGDLTRAVAEGIRGVELDPGDAESWLILGAAQMESGELAEARATFRDCARLATRGRVGECRAMLR